MTEIIEMVVGLTVFHHEIVHSDANLKENCLQRDMVDNSDTKEMFVFVKCNFE